jgi:hypothetical protein
MATSIPGLFRRGSAYYLRVVLPIGHPLACRYRSGRVVLSLGACSHLAAVLAGLARRATLLAGVQTSPATAAHPTAIARAAGSDLRLRHVYGRWAQSKRRSADALAACERALRLFESESGDPPINLITREHGDGFRAWLLNQHTTTKTARDRFIWVRALLKFAHVSKEELARHVELSLVKTRQACPAVRSGGQAEVARHRPTGGLLFRLRR